MIDYNALPNRDRLLENVYTSSPVLEKTVVGSGIIPKKPVEVLSTVIPDLSSPIFELDGKWVTGAKVQTFYKKEGSTMNLLATWFAIKDQVEPAEIKAKVAPEIQQVISEDDVVAGLKRMITLAREKQFHALATNASHYATGYTDTPSTKWNSGSNTTIISDIQTGIKKLALRGLNVTAMILPNLVYQNIKFAPELQNIYTGREKVDVNFFKDLFDIPNIVVPSVTTHGVRKKNPVATDLWGDDVILLHTAPLGSGTYPSFIEAVLMDALVERLPMDSETWKQDIIARECKGINFIKNDAAYLLKDVLA